MPETSAPLQSAPSREGGYDPRFFEELAQVEDRHFWFVSRNDLIARIAGKLARRTGAGSLVLEAGCGTGNVLRFLEAACPQSTVIGADLWMEGLQYARARTSCPLVVADVKHSPFARAFDIICLFDVLEHIPDDEQILRHLYSLLAPGGTLLITVPAYMSLWSYFDEASHHCRRYSKTDLHRKLTNAGFRVRFSTAFMACLFPLVWTTRRLARLRSSRNGKNSKDLASDELKIVPGLNSILRHVIAIENRWIGAGHRLPIGTSLLAVAQKPA